MKVHLFLNMFFSSALVLTASEDPQQHPTAAAAGLAAAQGNPNTETNPRTCLVTAAPGGICRGRGPPAVARHGS